MEPTGKRFLLAIDVSGSMESYNVLGSSSVTARTASAAMAMVTARTEANYHMLGFSNQLVKLDINASMKLEDVCSTIARVGIHNAAVKGWVVGGGGGGGGIGRQPHSPPSIYSAGTSE